MSPNATTSPPLTLKATAASVAAEPTNTPRSTSPPASNALIDFEQ